MKLKNLLALGLALAMTLSLAACGGGGGDQPSGSGNTPAAEEPGETGGSSTSQFLNEYGVDVSAYKDLDWPTVNLIGAAMTDDEGAIGAPMRFYFDLITEASGGKVTFQEFWQEQLCSGQDTYENVRDGIADFGQTPINYEYSPYILYQVCFTLPFITGDVALTGDALASLAEQFPEFREREEQIGVHVASIVAEADYQIATSDTLDPAAFDLSWFNGSKLAVGSSYFSRWGDALGAVPVTGLGATGTYEGYTTGVINGAFTYNSMMYDWQYIEVCSSMIEAKLGSLGGVASIWNMDTWNSFSPEIQTALDELAVLARGVYNEWRAEKEATANEDMYNDGLIKVEMTDEQRAEWAEKIFASDECNTIKQWISDMEAEGYTNGKEIVQAWADALKAGGYEFPYDVDAMIANS